MSENVETVGYLIQWDSGSTSYSALGCHPDDGTNEPLMTVAQHKRIVAGLEARLREAEDVVRICAANTGTFNPARKGIDAFLAQTAEGVT